jgi:hypothetical protein
MYLSCDDIYSDITLVLVLVSVEFFMLLMFCLSSRRWFVQRFMLVQVSGVED